MRILMIFVAGGIFNALANSGPRFVSSGSLLMFDISGVFLIRRCRFNDNPPDAQPEHFLIYICYKIGSDAFII